MSRIEFPMVNDFKVNEMLTSNIQINNNSFVNQSGDVINIQTGITGGSSSFILTTDSIGPTGATGAQGVQGVTGATGPTAINSVVSVTNAKVIIAYITSSGTISYQNGTAITSVTLVSTGEATLNIANGFYTTTPDVIFMPGASSQPNLASGSYYNKSNSTATSLIIYFNFNGTASIADNTIMIIGS